MGRKGIYPPSVTPGIPRLGPQPAGWRKATFGDVLQLVERPVVLHDATSYQLVTAKRSRGGIVPRERLSGRDIKTKTQFRVAKGDFLISNRQIIHGACGIVPDELDGALVSGEYSTLVSKDGLLLDYLAWYAHDAHFQKTCFHSSVGVDVEKMVFKIDNWLKEELYVPPISEQQRVIRILNTWESAITSFNSLIAQKLKYRQSLLQTLMRPRRADWQQLSLGQAASVLKGSGLSKGALSPTGTRKCLLYGELFTTYGRVISKVLSRSSSPEGTSSLPGDVLVPGSTTTVAADLATASVICEDGVALGGDINIIRAKGPARFDSTFLAYYLPYRKKTDITKMAQGMTIIHLYPTDLMKLELELPPLSEQRKIGTVLAALDDEISCLKRQARKVAQQQRGLIQVVFAGSTTTKRPK